MKFSLITIVFLSLALLLLWPLSKETQYKFKMGMKSNNNIEWSNSFVLSGNHFNYVFSNGANISMFLENNNRTVSEIWHNDKSGGSSGYPGPAHYITPQTLGARTWKDEPSKNQVLYLRSHLE